MSRMLLSKISTRALVLFIFLCAFLIRLMMNVVFQGINSPPDPNMGADHVEYNQLAQNIVKGHGYVLDNNVNIANTFRPPGTAFLLAICYYLFGINIVIARIMFCLIGAATCIVTYFIGLKLFSKRLGLLSAFILAIYPMHFYYSMHFFSEVPWAFFMSLAALSAIFLQERERIGYAILLGFFVAFSAYIRPTSIIFIPIYILVLYMYGFLNSRMRCLKFCTVPLLIFAICLMPWTLRNYKVTGHVIPITTHGGITFLGSHNEKVLQDPKLTGYWTSGSEEEIELRKKEINVYAKNKIAYKLGFNFIKKHLQDMPRLEIMKLYHLLTPLYGTTNQLFNIIGGTAWALIFPFCVFGIISTIRNILFAPLHSALLLTFFICLFFYGDHRFRESISPFLVIYACVSFIDILCRFKILKA